MHAPERRQICTFQLCRNLRLAPLRLTLRLYLDDLNLVSFLYITKAKYSLPVTAQHRSCSPHH